MNRFNTSTELTAAASVPRRSHSMDTGLKAKRHARVQGEGAARK